MNKILYALPALAMLGLIPAADADTVQERIQKLQERIEFFEAKIDRNPDSEKVAKWEARIDRLRDQIAELEARLGPVQTAQTITKSAPPQQEPTSARAEIDNTRPTVSSLTVFTDGTVVAEFSELIDADSFDHTDTDDLRLFQRGTWYTPAWNPMTVDASIITGTLDNVPSSSQFLFGVIAFGTVDDLAGNTNGFKNNIPVSLREPPDTTAPGFVSATLDMNDGTLTLVFDEVVDISNIVIGNLLLVDAENIADRENLLDGQFDTAVVTRIDNRS